MIFMPAYKDEKTGKWFAKFYYTNWQGIKKQKWKRGFATKKEALGFERDFLEQQSANPDMTFQNLYEIYMEDMAARLKQSTLLTKKAVLQTHILPFFDSKPINEIKASDVRRWQAKLMSSPNNYSQTYLKKINTELNSIINYAKRFYDLNTNPCGKAGTIGKAKAEEMDYWTYDEYIAKLSTGRVLGMVDQWWDFAYNVNDSLKQQGLDEKGCSYVPLPITIDEGIKNQWHCSGGVMNSGSGLAITTSCKDVEGALQFIDDLLSQDIHNLRFWGVEGVDYEVNDDGLFYRTEEQRKQAADTAYKASHLCSYSYFPNYKGTSDDGINANWPDDQPDEFFDSLNSAVQRCFKAYGAETYVDMLGTNETPGPWYPMYSFSGTMTTSTPGGVAWTKMGEIKHEYLPRTVMANDFESEWNTYMKAYEGCNPQDFLDEMQAELDRRMKEAAKFE